MKWSRGDVFRGPYFDDSPKVHDRDSFADEADDVEIVRNEEIGNPKFVAKIQQQVHNLCLDRDIERAQRLITNDEVRFESECSGNAYPLTLPPAEFVRVARHAIRAKSYLVEQLSNERFAFGNGLADIVDNERFGNDLFDGHSGVE